MTRVPLVPLSLLACAACSSRVALGTLPPDVPAASDVASVEEDASLPSDAPEDLASVDVAPDVAHADANAGEDAPPPVGTRYVAHVSGAETIPPTDTDLTAEADVYLDRATGTLDVRLRRGFTGAFTTTLVRAYAGEDGPVLRALATNGDRARVSISTEEADALEGGATALLLRVGATAVRGQITRPSERVLASEMFFGGFAPYSNVYNTPTGAPAGNVAALFDPETLRLRYHVVCRSTCGAFTYVAYDGVANHWLGSSSTLDGEVTVTRNFTSALARFRVDVRSGSSGDTNAPTSAILTPPGTRLYYARANISQRSTLFGDVSMLLARPWRSRDASLRVIHNGRLVEPRVALQRGFVGEVTGTWLELPATGEQQSTVILPSGFDEDVRDGRLLLTIQGRTQAGEAPLSSYGPVLPPGQGFLIRTLSGQGVVPPVSTPATGTFRYIFEAATRTLRVRGKVRDLRPVEARLVLPNRTVRWPAESPEVERSVTLREDEGPLFGQGLRLVLTSAAHPEGEIATP